MCTFNSAIGQVNSEKESAKVLNEDSLNYEKGISILSSLFNENDLYLENDISKEISFPWCKECEGKIGCCNTFKDTYRKYFTNELKAILNSSEFQRETSEADVFDENTGELIGNTKYLYMEFKYKYIDEKGDIHTYNFGFSKEVLKEWQLVRISGTW